jgi:NADH-quinone oxidoreductase subunit K
MIPLEHILYFAGALFAMGLLGLIWQTNLLRLLIAIEAMLNGAAFAFIGTAVHFNNVDGHMMFIMTLAIAAAEVGIGLAILLHYDRLVKTIDVSVQNA